ncbi:MAG: YncE family protein [Flavobacteriales bacterium]|nr:YncE family protein [Flavobacteriales bacterium]MCW8913442.1 YncE family protein [Flavobacteriales bacterium]MCW8938320.1 YncE family protein [Flavobacteriales bacterium]MCW8967931.1 YncE family protein [Flavobacteriales bacterium]MCW8990283.1 YncE family protein [Flavobacteriales bacterium]
MSKFNSNIVVGLALLMLIFSSCKKEEFGPQCINCEENAISPSIQNDVIIVNEGNFGFGNASLSLYNSTSKTVHNSIFQQANNYPLGDVAQSAYCFEKKIYTVINNSSKIEVIDKSNFSSIATITGFDSPRYFLPINSSKAYVSNIFSNKIDIINLTNNTISGSITTSSNWTEKMLVFNDTVYVCDMSNNKLILINKTNNQIIANISVGIQPNSLILDKNNKIWIMCDGGFNEANAQLIKFNPNIRTVEQTFVFSNISDSPSNLIIDSSKENLYFINNHIYKMNINDMSLPSSSWVSNNGEVFYSLGIHPTTYEIYVSDAKDFVQNSTIYIYSPNQQLYHQFQSGINAGHFLFLQ